MKTYAFPSTALIAILTCAAQWVYAAETTRAPTTERPTGFQELQKLCESSSCRHDLHIRLRRDKGKPYDETFELLPPAVQTSMITIHPGEKISAVPVFQGDTFTGWRTPRADEAADTQIVTIDLAQDEKRTSMSARVSTNSGPALKLRMGLIRLDGDDRPESTSSCPLQAGGFSSFEMWPYPIFVLMVADAKRLADDVSMVCE
jgi:hypothetical protein